MIFECLNDNVAPANRTSLILWDDVSQADTEIKKKRTFRKFTYRGVDLDQLLDMS